MKKDIQLINSKYYLKKDSYLLLEQYKLIVESADKITDKRNTANNFYLTVNSVILAILSYLTSIKSSFTPILLSFIGILVSIIWHQNIESYKRLNSAKFKVIHELEFYLPANIYQKEYGYLLKGYYKLTSVEKWMPVIFGAIYIIIAAITIYIFIT